MGVSEWVVDWRQVNTFSAILIWEQGTFRKVDDDVRSVEQYA
jgi:hypothetical protein